MHILYSQQTPIAGLYAVAGSVVVDAVAVATVTVTGANPIPATGPWVPGVGTVETTRLVDGLPVTTTTSLDGLAWPATIPGTWCEAIAGEIVAANAVNAPELRRWFRYGGRGAGLDVATVPAPFAVYIVGGASFVRFDPLSDPADGSGRLLDSGYAAGVLTGYGDAPGSLYNSGAWLWADGAGNLPDLS